MTSLASIPGEARCKQVVHYLLTNKTTCKTCDGKLSWRREYGWCGACRKKVRPKAQMWFRSSKLTYRQLFVLLYCWQRRQSPGAARLAAGLSYTTVRRWYWRFRWLVPLEKTEQLLSGIVEVDEAWFGKRKFGGQTIVMGAIERDTGRLKLATYQTPNRIAQKASWKTLLPGAVWSLLTLRQATMTWSFLATRMRAGTTVKVILPAPTTLKQTGVP